MALAHTVAPAPVLAYHALPDSGQTKSVRDRLSSASRVLRALHHQLLEQRPAARACPAVQASTAALKAAPCAVHAPLEATAPVAVLQAVELRVRQERIRSIRQQSAMQPASCVRQARTVPTMVPFPLSHVPLMEAASLLRQELKPPASVEMLPAPRGTFVLLVLAPRLLALQATSLPT